MCFSTFQSIQNLKCRDLYTFSSNIFNLNDILLLDLIIAIIKINVFSQYFYTDAMSLNCILLKSQDDFETINI